MPATWQQTYEQLKAFIAAHPSIEISPSCVVITGDIRPEFYRLFDTIRVDFIKENFPGELAKGYELGRNWSEVSQAVIESMGIEEIEITAGVKWFMADPVNGLMRGLFDPLFDLLKDRTDLASFEKKARDVVAADFERFFREGYHRWASISLIKDLDGDKVYSVPAIDYNNNASEMEGDPSGGLREDSVPEAEETKRIVFEYAMICSYLVPRIIIHSRKLNRYVAFRADFYEAKWKARLLSENREWLNIKAIEQELGRSDLWPNLAIYVADDLRDLFLVSDYHKVARPDVMVDFKEKENWYESEGLASIQRHYDALMPIMGAFLVSRVPVPEAAAKELEPKPVSATECAPEPSAESAPERQIRLIGAGYNQASLHPVLDAIEAAAALPEQPE
jgi:hypothetical protein